MAHFSAGMAHLHYFRKYLHLNTKVTGTGQTRQKMNGKCVIAAKVHSLSCFSLCISSHDSTWRHR